MSTRAKRTKGRKRNPGPPVCTYVEGEKLTENKTSGIAYFFLPDERGIKRRFYQGRFDDPSTLERASRWIREYRAAGGPPVDDALTVEQLVTRFMAHAREYYGDSTEIDNYESATRLLTDLYGSTPAEAFGPLKLKAVRDAMVEKKDWVRKTVNGHTGRIKRVFKWAASNELLPGSVVHDLNSVEGLRKSRSKAREGKKVRPALKHSTFGDRMNQPDLVWNPDGTPGDDYTRRAALEGRAEGAPLGIDEDRLREILLDVVAGRPSEGLSAPEAWMLELLQRDVQAIRDAGHVVDLP